MGHDILKNHWYIACASSRLGAEPRASRIGDEQIVLFRDRDGVPAALPDRCPHRGLRLSRGRIVDGELQCGFHGWRFDGNGRCVDVPSLPRDATVPKTFHCQRRPCVERDAYVWVWSGDEAPSYEPSLPEIRGGRWLQGTVDVSCNWERVVEINLDYCHVHFVHPTHPVTSHRNMYGLVIDDRPQTLVIKMTDHGFRAHSPADEHNPHVVPPGVPTVAFSLPDRIRYDYDIEGACTSYLHTVPTGSATCRIEWIMTASQAYPERIQWVDEAPVLFKEDESILNGIDPAFLEDDNRLERLVEGDAACLLYRRIVKLARAGEWEKGRELLEPLRILKFRW